MPELKADLVRLVAIPSISETGFPEPTRPALMQMYEMLVGMLREVGVEQLGSIELPGTAPVITGEIPGPEGAPTVLLYGHYDVVPAGDESAWDSPPWEATERDGAIYGRGTADTKSNLLVHIGALRAWEGRPPVGIKVLIEGQEEVGSPLELGYPTEHPEHFRADAVMIADDGNIRPGDPSITLSLRGDAVVTVEVRTLAGPKHSGLYGGAAPDALIVLLHALASLHDQKGDVAVAGLRRDEWTGTTYTEDEFRGLAEVESGLPLVGTGGLGERIWSGPAITVIGLDAPSVDGAVNSVQAYARAKLNVRVHPEQDAAQAQAAVIRHLQEVKPFGVPLTVHAGDTGNGFAAVTEGPAWEAMVRAMTAVWGSEPALAASGGAIPVVKAISDGVPEATMILFGTCDKFAGIHGPNERVLVEEFEKAVLVEARFFAELADRRKDGKGVTA